jgi:hypothetical protein
MKKSEFKRIKTYKYDDNTDDLNINDVFLMGEHMLDQLLNDDIEYASMYKVISKQGSNMSFIVEIVKLKEG